LRLRPGEPVHVVEGVSLADDQPIAAFRSLFPAARFPDLLRAVRETGSITRALAAEGLRDYTRAETRLTAELADPVMAAALGIRANGPVMRTVALNIDPDGAPVELGTTWFAGERVTLTVADQP
jgi:GntR family phosphonate transport system transcriptional regulator